MDDLNERVASFETDIRDVRERLIRVEARLDSLATSFATKSDLSDAISAQTWRLVTFVCGFGVALVSAVYFIATHVK